MANTQRFGYLMILASAGGFAFLPTLTRSIYAVSDFQPYDIALWRFLLATPIVWILLQFWPPARQANRTNMERIKLLLSGTLYAMAALSAFVGLERTPASTFVVLFFTYPAMVAVMSVFLGRRLTTAAWISLVLTLIGVALTVPDFSFSGADGVGILFAFINAFLVAVYFLVAEGLLKGNAISGSTYIITGTLLVLLLILPFQGLRMPTNPTTFFYLLALATVSTVLPIFTMNLGIKMVGPTPASIVSAVEPLLAMVVALVVLGEAILPVQWLGAAAIVSGVLILQIAPARLKRAPQPTT